MVGRHSSLLVTKRSLRNSDSGTGRRPRRVVQTKNVDDTVGLSRREEQELNKALYASLQENRRSKTLPGFGDSVSDYTSSNNIISSCVSSNNISSCSSSSTTSIGRGSIKGSRSLQETSSSSTTTTTSTISSSAGGGSRVCRPQKAVQTLKHSVLSGRVSPKRPSRHRELAANLSLDESSQDSVRSSASSHNGSKRKVHAQRKFAQGCSLPGMTSCTPVKFATPAVKVLSSRMPKTEDFLTFLCLRGSSILPAHLDFFNFSLEEPPSCKESSKPGSYADKNPREGTSDSSSTGSGPNDEVAEAANVTTPTMTRRSGAGSLARRSAARASAGTPETARGIVSLRQGLQRKVSTSSSSSSLTRFPVSSSCLLPASQLTNNTPCQYRNKFYFTPEKSPSPSKTSGIRPGEFTPPSLFSSTSHMSSTYKFSPLVCSPSKFASNEQPFGSPASQSTSSRSSSLSSTSLCGASKRKRRITVPSRTATTKVTCNSGSSLPSFRTPKCTRLDRLVCLSSFAANSLSVASSPVASLASSRNSSPTSVPIIPSSRSPAASPQTGNQVSTSHHPSSACLTPTSTNSESFSHIPPTCRNKVNTPDPPPLHHQPTQTFPKFRQSCRRFSYWRNFRHKRTLLSSQRNGKFRSASYLKYSWKKGKALYSSPHFTDVSHHPCTNYNTAHSDHIPVLSSVCACSSNLDRCCDLHECARTNPESLHVCPTPNLCMSGCKHVHNQSTVQPGMCSSDLNGLPFHNNVLTCAVTNNDSSDYANHSVINTWSGNDSGYSDQQVESAVQPGMCSSHLRHLKCQNNVLKCELTSGDSDNYANDSIFNTWPDNDPRFSEQQDDSESMHIVSNSDADRTVSRDASDIGVRKTCYRGVSDVSRTYHSSDSDSDARRICNERNVNVHVNGTFHRGVSDVDNDKTFHKGVSDFDVSGTFHKGDSNDEFRTSCKSISDFDVNKTSHKSISDINNSSSNNSISNVENSRTFHKGAFDIDNNRTFHNRISNVDSSRTFHKGVSDVDNNGTVHSGVSNVDVNRTFYKGVSDVDNDRTFQKGVSDFDNGTFHKSISDIDNRVFHKGVSDVDSDKTFHRDVSDFDARKFHRNLFDVDGTFRQNVDYNGGIKRCRSDDSNEIIGNIHSADDEGANTGQNLANDYKVTQKQRAESIDSPSFRNFRRKTREGHYKYQSKRRSRRRLNERHTKKVEGKYRLVKEVPKVKIRIVRRHSVNTCELSSNLIESTGELVKKPSDADFQKEFLKMLQADGRPHLPENSGPVEKMVYRKDVTWPGNGSRYLKDLGRKIRRNGMARLPDNSGSVEKMIYRKDVTWPGNGSRYLKNLGRKIRRNGMARLPDNSGSVEKMIYRKDVTWPGNGSRYLKDLDRKMRSNDVNRQLIHAECSREDCESYFKSCSDSVRKWNLINRDINVIACNEKTNPDERLVGVNEHCLSKREEDENEYVDHHRNHSGCVESQKNHTGYRVYQKYHNKPWDYKINQNGLLGDGRDYSECGDYRKKQNEQEDYKKNRIKNGDYQKNHKSHGDYQKNHTAHGDYQKNHCNAEDYQKNQNSEGTSKNCNECGDYQKNRIEHGECQRNHSDPVGDKRNHSDHVGNKRNHSDHVGDKKNCSDHVGDKRNHSDHVGDKRNHSDYVGGMRNHSDHVSDKRNHSVHVGDKRNRSDHVGDKKNCSDHVGDKRNHSDHVGDKRNYSDHVGDKRNYSDYVGDKRNHYDHVGDKRNHSDHVGDKRNHSDHVGDKRNYSDHVGDKRNYSDYVGDKRNHYDHVGDKRNHSDHVGDKRNHSDYVGDKRNHSDHVGDKKNHSDYVGDKRNHSDYVGDKRNHSDHVGDKINHNKHVNCPRSHSNHVNRREFMNYHRIQPGLVSSNKTEDRELLNTLSTENERLLTNSPKESLKLPSDNFQDGNSSVTARSSNQIISYKNTKPIKESTNLADSITLRDKVISAFAKFNRKDTIISSIQVAQGSSGQPEPTVMLESDCTVGGKLSDKKPVDRAPDVNPEPRSQKCSVDGVPKCGAAELSKEAVVSDLKEDSAGKTDSGIRLLEDESSRGLLNESKVQEIELDGLSCHTDHTRLDIASTCSEAETNGEVNPDKTERDNTLKGEFNLSKALDLRKCCPGKQLPLHLRGSSEQKNLADTECHRSTQVEALDLSESGKASVSTNSYASVNQENGDIDESASEECYSKDDDFVCSCSPKDAACSCLTKNLQNCNKQCLVHSNEQQQAKITAKVVDEQIGTGISTCGRQHEVSTETETNSAYKLSSLECNTKSQNTSLSKTRISPLCRRKTAVHLTHRGKKHFKIKMIDVGHHTVKEYEIQQSFANCKCHIYETRKEENIIGAKHSALKQPTEAGQQSLKSHLGLSDHTTALKKQPVSSCVNISIQTDQGCSEATEQDPASRNKNTELTVELDSNQRSVKVQVCDLNLTDASFCQERYASSDDKESRENDNVVTVEMSDSPQNDKKSPQNDKKSQDSTHLCCQNSHDILSSKQCPPTRLTCINSQPKGHSSESQASETVNLLPKEKTISNELTDGAVNWSSDSRQSDNVDISRKKLLSDSSPYGASDSNQSDKTNVNQDLVNGAVNWSSDSRQLVNDKARVGKKILLPDPSSCCSQAEFSNQNYPSAPQKMINQISQSGLFTKQDSFSRLRTRELQQQQDCYISGVTYFNDGVEKYDPEKTFLEVESDDDVILCDDLKNEITNDVSLTDSSVSPITNIISDLVIDLSLHSRSDSSCSRSNSDSQSSWSHCSNSSGSSDSCSISSFDNHIAGTYNIGFPVAGMSDLTEISGNTTVSLNRESVFDTVVCHEESTSTDLLDLRKMTTRSLERELVTGTDLTWRSRKVNSLNDPREKTQSVIVSECTNSKQKPHSSLYSVEDQNHRLNPHFTHLRSQPLQDKEQENRKHINLNAELNQFQKHSSENSSSHQRKSSSTTVGGENTSEDNTFSSHRVEFQNRSLQSSDCCRSLFEIQGEQLNSENSIILHSYGSLNTGKGFTVVNGKLKQCEILNKQHLQSDSTKCSCQSCKSSPRRPSAKGLATATRKHSTVFNSNVPRAACGAVKTHSKRNDGPRKEQNDYDNRIELPNQMSLPDLIRDSSNKQGGDKCHQRSPRFFPLKNIHSDNDSSFDSNVQSSHSGTLKGAGNVECFDISQQLEQVQISNCDNLCQAMSKNYMQALKKHATRSNVSQFVLRPKHKRKQTTISRNHQGISYRKHLHGDWPGSQTANKLVSSQKENAVSVQQHPRTTQAIKTQTRGMLSSGTHTSLSNSLGTARSVLNGNRQCVSKSYPSWCVTNSQPKHSVDSVSDRNILRSAYISDLQRFKKEMSRKSTEECAYSRTSNLCSAQPSTKINAESTFANRAVGKTPVMPGGHNSSYKTGMSSLNSALPYADVRQVRDTSVADLSNGVVTSDSYIQSNILGGHSHAKQIRETSLSRNRGRAPSQVSQHLQRITESLNPDASLIPAPAAPVSSRSSSFSLSDHWPINLSYSGRTQECYSSDWAMEIPCSLSPTSYLTNSQEENVLDVIMEELKVQIALLKEEIMRESQQQSEDSQTVKSRGRRNKGLSKVSVWPRGHRGLSMSQNRKSHRYGLQQLDHLFDFSDGSLNVAGDACRGRDVLGPDCNGSGYRATLPGNDAAIFGHGLSRQNGNPSTSSDVFMLDGPPRLPRELGHLTGHGAGRIGCEDQMLKYADAVCRQADILSVGTIEASTVDLNMLTEQKVKDYIEVSSDDEESLY